jgi:hypothetical protein
LLMLFNDHRIWQSCSVLSNNDFSSLLNEG